GGSILISFCSKAWTRVSSVFTMPPISFSDLFASCNSSSTSFSTFNIISSFIRSFLHAHAKPPPLHLPRLVVMFGRLFSLDLQLSDAFLFKPLFLRQPLSKIVSQRRLDLFPRI